MDEYLRRARTAILEFQAALDAFDQTRQGLVPAAEGTATSSRRLEETIERLRTAIGRLQRSLAYVSGETALDLVDLQVRLEGETSGLAAALKALGEIVARDPAIATTAGGTLYALEEGAERVAAAVFPNTVEGVREINRTLWEFRPLWNEYTRTLAKELGRPAGSALTADQIAAIERTAGEIRARFDDVNELLNRLVGGSAESASVRSVIAQARRALSSAIGEATSKAADTYKRFHGVLQRAERLAKKVDGQFARLRVPIFPSVSGLDALEGVVDPAQYGQLAGVERFALLNITARLRSIGLADGPGEHLLSPRFGIRVFDVFPDRIYFSADAAFITAVRALKDARVFEDAPASLHRFRDGSYKQRQLRRGNLQLSYAFGTAERPDDRSRVRVDADIDLYRSPVRHLFGEVLVNHLTGSRTDQFRVWDILAAARVVPIEGFELVTV